MRLLLLPARLVYRGLIWLANSPRTLMLAYLLLIVATFCAMVFVNFIRRRLLNWTV